MHVHVASFFRRRSRVGCFGTLIGLIVGCTGSAPDDDQETEFASKSEGLAARSADYNLWNLNNNVVDICWTDGGRAVDKDKVKTAIEASWRANSGLVFNWPASADTLCPAAPIPAHYMPIELRDGGYGGHCENGYGARQAPPDPTNPDDPIANNCSNGCQCFIYGAGDDLVMASAVHEIGHGLGLPHEHQRLDRPSDIEATCADGNPNPDKWTNDWQYSLDSSFRLLTQYDGLDSVMSYCRDLDRDGVPDLLPELSAMDRLGIEMLYPFNLTRRIVAIGGVMSADGATAIVRSDVSTTFTVDWIARGGMSSALSNFRWKLPSSGTVIWTTASPSFTFTTAAFALKVTHDDVLLRHHASATTIFVANNSLHTAILQPEIL
jgi:hypothetical protein